MVQMEDLYPGMRVRIVDRRNDRNAPWNSSGKMDHWLGKIMTVRSVNERCAHMEEDRNEREGGWAWYPHMIECIEEDEKMPDAPALDNLF